MLKVTYDIYIDENNKKIALGKQDFNVYVDSNYNEISKDYDIDEINETFKIKSRDYIPLQNYTNLPKEVGDLIKNHMENLFKEKPLHCDHEIKFCREDYSWNTLEKWICEAFDLENISYYVHQTHYSDNPFKRRYTLYNNKGSVALVAELPNKKKGRKGFIMGFYGSHIPLEIGGGGNDYPDGAFAKSTVEANAKRMLHFSLKQIASYSKNKPDIKEDNKRIEKFLGYNDLSEKEKNIYFYKKSKQQLDNLLLNYPSLKEENSCFIDPHKSL